MNNNNSSRRHRIRIHYNINVNLKAFLVSIICFLITIFFCGLTWKPSYIKNARDFEKEWHTRQRCTYTLLSKEFLPAHKGEGEYWFILKNSKEKISLEVDKKTYISSGVGDRLTFNLTKCDKYCHSDGLFITPIIYYFLLLGVFWNCFLLAIGILVFDELRECNNESDLVIPRRVLWASFWVIVISGIIVNILVYA